MKKSSGIGLVLAFVIMISYNPWTQFPANSDSKINLLPSPYDLINEVNALRTSNGLSPYTINQTLMNVAQAHTDYQASIGFVTHYGADGSRPFQRALAAGYPVAGDISLGGFFSENITAGTNLSVYEAVLSWQQDAPHLTTMLSSIHQDIGAGVTNSGDWIYYTIDVGLSTENLNSSTPMITSETNSFSQVIINPLLTSTPNPSGSIIHTVKLGETIWVISQIYKVSEIDIIQMNNLPNDLIYVGDQLLIREGFTETPTLPTYTLTTTPTDTSTATKSPTMTPTLINEILVESKNEFDNVWYLMFLLIIFLGITFFAIYRIRMSH